MEKMMHLLFFTVFTALTLFHNNFYGMEEYFIKPFKDYRPAKDALLQDFL